MPPRPARAGAARRRAWRPSRCASWSTHGSGGSGEVVEERRHPNSFAGCHDGYTTGSATLDDARAPATVPGRQGARRETSVQRPWGNRHMTDTIERSDASRGRPRPRSPRGPLRRRLRRRHAAHRRPVHVGQRIVRQRPVDDARLPGRDPRTRRHRERRVVVPGEHRRPRHHHPGRRAQRPGRHEPGGPDGRPPPPRAGRHRDRQRGRVRRTQPRQGRLHRRTRSTTAASPTTGCCACR